MAERTINHKILEAYTNSHTKEAVSECIRLIQKSPQPLHALKNLYEQLGQISVFAKLPLSLETLTKDGLQWAIVDYIRDRYASKHLDKATEDLIQAIIAHDPQPIAGLLTATYMLSEISPKKNATELKTMFDAYIDNPKFKLVTQPTHYIKPSEVYKSVTGNLRIIYD